MRVFVKNMRGEPLMPTTPRKARILLREGKAKVIQRTPFTIQLKYVTGEAKQEITLGIDTGFKTIGVSAITEKEEMFSAEVDLRTDVSDKVTERRMYRRNRRNRKRYGKPRFDNRKKTQTIAPSVRQKADSHIRIIDFVKSVLPISKVRVETGNFDPHKLKNSEVKGKDYQQGEQSGFENVKSYVLTRDNYQCFFSSVCSKKLHVHHIRYRSDGGSDTPQNLITLCEKHHKQLHDGKISLPKDLKHKSLKSATIMNIIRNQVIQSVPKAEETFGYITKHIRQTSDLEKTHSTDAFVIAGGTIQKRCNSLKMKFKRKNNRALQLNRKGFRPSVRKQRYSIQPQDLVKWNGRIYKAVGIQNKGAYLKMTDGTKSFVKSVRQIQVVVHQKTLVVI